MPTLTTAPTNSAGVSPMVDLMMHLVDADPACMDIDALDDARAGYQRLLGWVQSRLLACTQRHSELASTGQAGDPVLTLVNQGGQSNSEATSTIEQAALCNDHTELEESLANGEISSTYLAIIARRRSRLSDLERSDLDHQMSEVHEWARSMTVADFERRLKRLCTTIRATHRQESDTAELERQRQDSHIKSWVDRNTGMHHKLLVMDPLRAAKFTSAHMAELAALSNTNKNNQGASKHQTYGSMQIDALINAVTGGVAASRSSELIVIVDHDTLTTTPHDNTICETIDGDPVPASIARTMAGESHLTVMFRDANRSILAAIDERTASRQQRRALAAMYRTCAWHGCDVPISQTRMHHVTFYRNGGPTKLANLLPLCERHHHMIHDQGWQLTLDPSTRTATFHPPNNPNHTTTTTPDRGPP